MKEVGFCILFQVLKHLFGLLEALFNFTYNGFALPLNDEGMILAGWQRGNLGKPSPTINASYVQPQHDSCHLFWQVCCEVLIHARVPAYQIQYLIERIEKGGHKAYIYSVNFTRQRNAFTKGVRPVWTALVIAMITKRNRQESDLGRPCSSSPVLGE